MVMHGQIDGMLSTLKVQHSIVVEINYGTVTKRDIENQKLLLKQTIIERDTEMNKKGFVLKRFSKGP